MTKFVTLPIDRLNQVILALNSYCNTGEIDCADDLVAELLAERDQKQVEQEPVAKVVLTEQLGLPCLQWLDLDRQFDFKGGELLYTHPQPKREPLTDDEARRIYNEATYHASIAVFMTRMDAEHQDADDKGVSGWLQEAEDRVKCRIIGREPLTNEQVKAGLINLIEYTDARERCAFNIGVRFAERAHGIK